MAHTPILRIFKIYLQQARGGGAPSFAELLAAKFPAHGAPSELGEYTPHYRELFKQFLSETDNNFHSNSRLKKAIGIRSQRGTAGINRTIIYKSDENIISGRIKGGRYGQKRSLGDITAPADEHTDINESKVVLDEFYFLLYTPLDSNKGVLIIQNYSDDSINDVFTLFIRKLLKGPGFKQPKVEPFTPKHVIEEFRDRGLIHEFRYTDDVLVLGVDKKDAVATNQVKIQVKVTIPDGAAPKELRGLSKWIGKIRMATSKGEPLTLDQFRSKMGTIKNGTKMSSFDLDGSTDIQPTINLQEKINLQPDGTPVWTSLAQYCDELLEDVIPEIYPENEES